MRDRPPGADQLVPDLSGEPEISVAVVVDVPDLGSSCLGISVPVAGDADPTRTVLIPLLEDSIPSQDLALYLGQQFIVHLFLPHSVRPPYNLQVANRFELPCQHLSYLFSPIACSLMRDSR